MKLTDALNDVLCSDLLFPEGGSDFLDVATGTKPFGLIWGKGYLFARLRHLQYARVDFKQREVYEYRVISYVFVCMSSVSEFITLCLYDSKQLLVCLNVRMHACNPVHFQPWTVCVSVTLPH